MLEAPLLVTLKLDDLTDLFKSLPWKAESKPKRGRSQGDQRHAIGIVLIHGSWQHKQIQTHQKEISASLKRSVSLTFSPYMAKLFYGYLCIDETPEVLEEWLNILPTPPGDLPVAALIVQKRRSKAKVYYMREAFEARIPTTEADYIRLLGVARRYREEKVEQNFSIDLDYSKFEETANETLRIFIAGDRSSVGKSSTCLGIIGNLIERFGYQPQEVAYIKPATQSESTQLIEMYCREKGIECVPIGPVVYYRGFTRAFLAGDTESTEHLLRKAQRAVDRISFHKKVILIDGVGFPAVGSICGTDNASVAKACGYRISETERKPCGVILVGGSGVGAAVDAFNLNATYFQSAGVPVLGAIFNKLDLEGFYSLENCKQQVSSYFEQYQTSKEVFGFMAKFPGIVGKGALQNVGGYFELFHSSVNIRAILEQSARVKESTDHNTSAAIPKAPKRLRPNDGGNGTQRQRSRTDIESAAINAGAAPSA